MIKSFDDPKQSGFSLTEVLMVMATLGVLVGSMYGVQGLLVKSKTTAEFYSHSMIINQDFTRYISNGARCTNAIEKKNFDFTSAQRNNIPGLSISFNTTDPELATIRANAELPAYDLRIVRFDITNAVSLGTRRIDINGDIETFQGYSAILTAEYEALKNVDGAKRTRMHVGALTLSVNSTGSIAGCSFPTQDPIAFCADRGLVFIGQGENKSLNGVDTDEDGCVPPSALLGDRGPRGQRGAAGPAGSRGPRGPRGRTSDQMVKTELSEFYYGLKEIMQIRPIWFQYNGLAGTPEGRVESGVMAQELEKVAPDLVTKKEIPLHPEAKKKQSIRHVDYDAINMMLIRAIQEQQKQIDSLKEELQKSKSKKEEKP